MQPDACILSVIHCFLITLVSKFLIVPEKAEVSKSHADQKNCSFSGVMMLILKIIGFVLAKFFVESCRIKVSFETNRKHGKLPKGEKIKLKFDFKRSKNKCQACIKIRIKNQRLNLKLVASFSVGNPLKDNHGRNIALLIEIIELLCSLFT
jgi:hypothetical protein